MKSFQAQLDIKGTKMMFEFPCFASISVKEACEIVQESLKLTKPLISYYNNTEMSEGKRFFKYCTPNDPIIFCNKDKSAIEMNSKVRLYSKILPGHWRTYTTMSYQSLILGEDIAIDERNSFEDIRLHLKRVLMAKHALLQNPELEILVYLPGGIPFVKGTLYDYKLRFPESRNHLYVIPYNVSRVKSQLDKEIENICNISEANLRNCFSPQIVCNNNNLHIASSLIGLFSYNGKGSDKILQYFSQYFGFSPFITSFWRLVNRYRITYRQLIVICSFLLCIFKESCKGRVSDDLLWEKAPSILTSIVYANVRVPVGISLFQTPYSNSPEETYLSEYLPKNDGYAMLISEYRGLAIPLVSIDIPSIEACDKDYANDQDKVFHFFRVLDLRIRNDPCLFIGPDGISLFLSQCKEKDYKSKDNISIFLPEKGFNEHVLIEGLDQSVKQNQSSLSSLLSKSNGQSLDFQIDNNIVNELIFVCVDESGSMGGVFKSPYSKMDALNVFLTEICRRMWAYRLNAQFGLLGFESKINLILKLDNIPDSFEKNVNKLVPRGATAMFMGMQTAAQELINASRQYPNATKRLIVFSSSRDNCGTPDLVTLFRMFVDNKIYVDSVIIDSEIEYRLYAASRLTGGSVVFPKSVSDGLGI